MAAKKEKVKHLGRGLEALMGSTAPEVGSKGHQDSNYRQIALESINANPYQPRTAWDDGDIDELAASIKTNGVIQPIIVRPTQAGYEIIAGERRFRAAGKLGLATVPAILKQASDEQMLEMALVENIQRKNLNPIERAKAYQNYIENFSMSQTEAAEKLGESRSVIANHIRLLDLPETIAQMIVEGDLSMGHARAILALPTDDMRRKLANKALAGRLSVREVEEIVRKALQGDTQEKPEKPARPAHIDLLEKQISSRLNTKVSINTNKTGRRGKITIEFYSPDEFERLAGIMGFDVNDDLS